MTAKVFRLNDYDWWIGESLEAVIKIYLDVCELPEEKADEMVDDPRELTIADMERIKYIDESSSATTFAGRFYQMLSEGYDGRPMPFATTEY